MSAKTFLAESKDTITSDCTEETIRFEPIIENGIYHGMLVQSPLERVALFSWKRMILTLSDISRLRQALMRFQASRGVLYVSADIPIPSSFSPDYS